MRACSPSHISSETSRFSINFICPQYNWKAVSLAGNPISVTFRSNISSFAYNAFNYFLLWWGIFFSPELCVCTEIQNTERSHIHKIDTDFANYPDCKYLSLEHLTELYFLETFILSFCLLDVEGKVKKATQSNIQRKKYNPIKCLRDVDVIFFCCSFLNNAQGFLGFFIDSFHCCLTSRGWSGKRCW